MRREAEGEGENGGGTSNDRRRFVTGRDAPAGLIDFADLVTEMTKVKHPMDAGQKGQKCRGSG